MFQLHATCRLSVFLRRRAGQEERRRHRRAISEEHDIHLAALGHLGKVHMLVDEHVDRTGIRHEPVSRRKAHRGQPKAPI